MGIRNEADVPPSLKQGSVCPSSRVISGQGFGSLDWAVPDMRLLGGYQDQISIDQQMMSCRSHWQPVVCCWPMPSESFYLLYQPPGCLQTWVDR